MARWFLPETPDLLGALMEQVAVTQEGMAALVAWAHSGGGEAEAKALRDAEHRADDKKRALRMMLKQAFTTPLDPEDLYILSERLDEVLNGAKDAVRETEVMNLPPDAAVTEMCELLAQGVDQLAEAFAHLGPNQGGTGSEATDAADAAVKSRRGVERVYRAAMSSLIEVEDLREVTGRREVYRRYSRLADELVSVAERVWYAVVKEG